MWGVFPRLKQYEHTLAERRIMEDISHPFLVWWRCAGDVTSSLRYAFQSQSKLYLVMDFFNGGELFHYLSMGRFSEVPSLPSLHRRTEPSSTPPKSRWGSAISTTTTSFTVT